tara:strand:- start:104 stop:340 length:237 start_codon:yes stop_codon:yes gene_type:complete
MDKRMLVFLKQKKSCPYCGLLNAPEESKCIHCGKEFSKIEVERFSSQIKEQRKKSKILGALFVLFFLVFFVIIAEVFF